MKNQLLDSANEWLEAHINQTLLIRKEEQGDIDKLRLTLEHIAFRNNKQGSDDYTNGKALLLQGNGVVINGHEELPLPQNTFVVPLNGLRNVSDGQEQLKLETERASYTFTIQH